jgi:DNA-binding SARP family transcriptional activator
LADPRVRIQLCGQVCIEIDGERRDQRLPGPQGRRLFAYLAIHRLSALTRQDLSSALWGGRVPSAPDAALNALLSRLRATMRPVPFSGLRPDLPAGTWVDLDAARDAIHRAESAVALGNWGRAWGAAQVTLFTARRGFLPGEDLPWISDVRNELESLHIRALGAYAEASLRVAGTELATAERSARDLVARAPFRESGYRVLMEALAARGNTAEALRVYDDLVRLLSAELGVVPSQPTRDLHAKLLGAGT